MPGRHDTLSDETIPASRAVLGPQSLGEALRMLRHRARRSRDQLASDAGVSAGAISNYENDVSIPPAPTLRKLCRVLAEALEWSRSDLWEQMGILIDQFDGRQGEGPD